ncbi:MAG: nitric oxide reductase transcriptional regulator NorR [Planctomycetes bacterium]|nr:nitric oxide reductase transcriptional regulator NorR [Planctomycetota bacterium]
MAAGDVILDIALDLTASLSTEDRSRRLLQAVRQIIPCDAAALLQLDDDALVPVATHGLVPEAGARRYRLDDHPRLARICASREPLQFPPDCDLPDPFDGLVADDATALHDIHACLGFPLHVGDELVGVLTVDALEPGAFDDLDPEWMRFLGALAGAAMRTSRLIATLEQQAAHLDSVARDYMRDAATRRGGDFIGQTAAARRLHDDIRLVAQTDYVVLITGETGTGKELVARAIHHASRRRDKPLIYLNCAALPESVAESELFGHTKGAFTGASSARPGKFEVADQGSLFLDEIGELPLGIQSKLLRVLQEGEIQRVGADHPVHVDVRILAATNRDLEVEVREGRFRADLYHRLAVYPIAVPPLRDRRADIPLLAGHFADLARRRLGLGPVRLDAAARKSLVEAAWPGNVRELENQVARAVLRAAAGVPRGEPVVVGLEYLGVEADAAVDSGSQVTAAVPTRPDAPDLPLSEAVDEYRRQLIRHAVEANGGNWAAAARTLGMHRSNLHTLAKRLGIR